MRQKTCCASELNTSVRFVFANRSGFDAPIGVAVAWEERGSCLNIFRKIHRGRISEAFMNYEAKDLLRKRQIVVRSQKLSRITRQKIYCACELNTSVPFVFANRSGFDAPIGVVMAWEERGSCLNIFRKTNRGRISETFTNFEAKHLLRKVVLMQELESSWHGRSVDRVLTYFGQEITVGCQRPSRITRQKDCCAIGSQKPSRITGQKTCCARVLNTSICFVFANQSGYVAGIGVFMAWEEHESCLNIFRKTNRGRISETFTNYEAKDSLRK
ncbi:uncharacterized protein G2W53_026445 [Senna tora]|uniref:Uncharacterized protein n=1 Tax=Senna tora TaxID=362788 RepID=A0A834THG3_9FABA|nr:uncharacterized protein G2W53_026445 [Senna tora]